MNGKGNIGTRRERKIGRDTENESRSLTVGFQSQKRVDAHGKARGCLCKMLFLLLRCQAMDVGYYILSHTEWSEKMHEI